MASQSEAIVQRIRQKRHDIAVDLDQLNQSIHATYKQATDWRDLTRANAVPVAVAVLFLGLLLGLAVGKWREE